MQGVQNWALLVPVYLFMRANKLKQAPTYGWAWLAIFAISLIPLMSNPVTTADKNQMKVEIQTGINQQLADRGSTATCTDVAIVDKSDREFEGLVTFSDGSKAMVDITVGSDGMMLWKVRP